MTAIPIAEDPDRLRLRPEVRLARWEKSARPIRALLNEPLSTLGRELCRSVLVSPQQSHDGAAEILERLLATRPHIPEECLPIADACNALACIGVDVPEIAELRTRYDVPAFTAVEPALPGRVRGGLIALSYGDLARAAYVAPEPPGEPYGGRAFSNDMLAFVGYARSILRAGGSAAALANATRCISEELDLLCASDQLDEPTALWIARLVHHRLDGAPISEVARRAHAWLWQAPAQLRAARHELPSTPHEFPASATLGEGAFRIEQRLLGDGFPRLYRGLEVATGRSVLVTIDVYSARKQSLDDLRAAVSYQAPGVFELAYAGTFDKDVHHWAIVERVTPGDWLPRILGPAEPWPLVRKAVDLGTSAGRLLLAAARAGIVLAQIRPELLWAQRLDGRLEVTGLSTRAIELFRRAKGDMATLPVFEYWYRAPEANTNPDDRSVTFALAAMIAEWATGRYPLLSSYGRETASHGPIDLPSRLRALLEAGLAEAPASRPDLASFVAALERL